MAGKYDYAKMELLVKVALQCVADDKDDRPTMNQVVARDASATLGSSNIVGNIILKLYAYFKL
jgi:hypothetical protein